MDRSVGTQRISPDSARQRSQLLVGGYARHVDGSRAAVLRAGQRALTCCPCRGSVLGDLVAVVGARPGGARDGHAGVVAAAERQLPDHLRAPPASAPTRRVPLPAGAVGAELTVRMGTWNVLKSNSNSRIVAGLLAIGAAGADVIGVQELQRHLRATVARRMKQAGWEMSDGNSATPVFWRASKYTLLAQGRVKVFGVVRIESGGAAGSSIGPKFIQWVQLQDNTTKAVFIAASHHLVPTIETKGHPNRQGPKRVAYAKQQIIAAGELATRLSRGGQIPFLIAADWNVDARKDAKSPHRRLPLSGIAAVRAVLELAGRRLPEGRHPR